MESERTMVAEELDYFLAPAMTHVSELIKFPVWHSGPLVLPVKTKRPKVHWTVALELKVPLVPHAKPVQLGVKVMVCASEVSSQHAEQGVMKAPQPSSGGDTQYG